MIAEHPNQASTFYYDNELDNNILIMLMTVIMTMTIMVIKMMMMRVAMARA